MKCLPIAAWVLWGQIVGCFCAAMLLSIIGLSSQALPFLALPTMSLALYITTVTALPIVSYWLLLRRFGDAVNRIVVSIVSYVSALSVFVWLARITDGSMHAAGMMLPKALVLVPIRQHSRLAIEHAHSTEENSTRGGLIAENLNTVRYGLRTGTTTFFESVATLLVKIAGGSGRVAVEAQRKLCQFGKTRDERSDKEAD